MGDEDEKRSSHSACPREHLKDKPVDVSCSVPVQTWSRVRDDRSEGRKELTNERVPGIAGEG